LIGYGALGDFRGAQVELFMDKPPSYWWGGFSGRARSNWRSSRAEAGGGILIMNLSHYIDLVRFLVRAEPAEITSAASFEEGMEVEESISVTVQYENGGLGSFVASSAIPGIYRESLFRLWGTEGAVELEPDARAYSIRSIPGIPSSRWTRFAEQRHSESRTRFVASFCRAIIEGSNPDIGPEDALAAQAFIEAAYSVLDGGLGVSPKDLLGGALTPK
jgi:predicted dehydrogenase